jgi:hypothetical protein
VSFLILSLPETFLPKFAELMLVGLHFGLYLIEMVGVEFVVLYHFAPVFGELTLQTLPFLVFPVPLFESGYFLLIS